MKGRTLLRLAGLLLLAVALASCGGGEVNVQATADAAIAATASAQGQLQATIEAAVAATQVAQGSGQAAGAVGLAQGQGAEVEPASTLALPEALPTAPPPLPIATPPLLAATPSQLRNTPTSSAPRCQVVTAGLSLRRGPGQIFNPPLRSLARGTALKPLSFVGRGFPSGQWVEVQVVTGGQRGWVSAGPQFLSCNVSMASLPAGVAPPTPTPRSSTATPTRISVTLPPPPATPTRVPPLAVLPVDGGCSGTPNIRNSRDIKGGCNVILPGFETYEVSDPMVFRDRIVFQAEVFDSNAGLTDGAGIDSVTFIIDHESGVRVHERTERNAGYCAFGGGEPTCEVWRFSEHNDQWPGGASVQYGRHDVQIIIQPKSGGPVTWFWSFSVAAP